MKTTLETRATETAKTDRSTQETGTCGFCGIEYDMKKRIEAIRNFPQPNSAHLYCSNGHWAYETSMQETASGL